MTLSRLSLVPLTLLQLTELYGEYLTALTKWANSALDIQFSAQVSYNMAMDMVSNSFGT
jgi:hypothetical protein